MNKLFTRSLALAIVPIAAVWAGGLFLEGVNPSDDPEAKSMNAVLVARATVCHEPAKSTVSATISQIRNGKIERQSLKVVPMKTAGSYAVIGTVPSGSVLEVALTNPEYGAYSPHLLVRADANGIQWATMKQISGPRPIEPEVKSLLGAVD